MPTPIARSFLDTMSFSRVGGGHESVGGTKENWARLALYRGRHCPRCIKHLNILNEMRAAWTGSGFNIAPPSADTLEKFKTERGFAKLGTFVIRSDGSIVLISILNGPSTRSYLNELQGAIIFTKKIDRLHAVQFDQTAPIHLQERPLSYAKLGECHQIAA